MFDGGPSCAIIVRDGKMRVAAGANWNGRVAAGMFASAGAKAHFTDIDEDAVADQAPRASGVGAPIVDASSPQDIARTVSDVRARFGGLDVFVNNLSVVGPAARISVDVHVERL